MKNKLEIIVLMTILTLSFFVRWNQIETLPQGFEQDEYQWTITSFLNTHQVSSSRQGVWSVIEETSHLFPVTFILNQASFFLFGDDIVSPRKLLTIISVFSLLFFYIFSRLFISSPIALVLLLVYSFSPYKLITSRIVEGPAYSDLCVFLVLFILLKVKLVPKISTFILLFISGCLIYVSLLTYNLAYSLPVVMGLIFITRLFSEKIPVKRSILFIFCFFIPLVLVAPHTYSVFSKESAAKSYAYSDTLINIKNKNIVFHTERFYPNVKTIQEQLFGQSKYDMLISYHGPLIPIAISLSFVGGLFFLFYRIRRYYPMLFLLSIPVFYHLIVGLNNPRWWFLSISFLFLVAGIFWEHIYRLTLKFPLYLKGILWSIFIVLCVLLAKSELTLYYSEAIKNSAFSSGKNREMFEITREYKSHLLKNIIFVFKDGDWFTTDLITRSAVAFNFSNFSPQKAYKLSYLTEKDMLILSNFEFLEKLAISRGKIVVVDNDLVDYLKETLKGSHDTYQKRQYFTLFLPNPL